MLLGVPYRELDGYLDGSWGHEHNTPEFTAIWKRIGKNMPKLQAEDTSAAVEGRVLRLVVDATGMAMHNRGEWIRHKWSVKRGVFKIHLLIDLYTRRIVAFSMTGMDGGDAGQLPGLLSKALKRYAGESIPLTCQLAEMANAVSISMTGARLTCMESTCGSLEPAVLCHMHSTRQKYPVFLEGYQSTFVMMTNSIIVMQYCTIGRMPS